MEQIMAYHIGDCPKCGARLLVEFEDANDYYDIDLSTNPIDITYHAKCWKCGTIVEAIISATFDETPMSIYVVQSKYAEHIYNVLKTRDLSKWEKSE